MGRFPGFEVVFSELVQLPLTLFERPVYSLPPRHSLLSVSHALLRRVIGPGVRGLNGCSALQIGG